MRIDFVARTHDLISKYQVVNRRLRYFLSRNSSRISHPIATQVGVIVSQISDPHWRNVSRNLIYSFHAFLEAKTCHCDMLESFHWQ